jgi:hypothetical protein
MSYRISPFFPVRRTTRWLGARDLEEDPAAAWDHSTRAAGTIVTLATAEP